MSYINSRQKYVDRLKHMSNREILANHRTINKYTKINVHVNHPQSCGTSSNAILEKAKKTRRFNHKSYKSSQIANILFTIASDTSYQKKVYQVCIIPKTIPSFDMPFGGHAFCIIKLNANKYAILQSYYPHYDLRNCNKYAKIFYSKFELLHILCEVVYFVTINKIDQRVIKSWEKLTGIDLSHLEGYEFDEELIVEVNYADAKVKIPYKFPCKL